MGTEALTRTANCLRKGMTSDIFTLLLTEKKTFGFFSSRTERRRGTNPSRFSSARSDSSSPASLWTTLFLPRGSMTLQRYNAIMPTLPDTTRGRARRTASRRRRRARDRAETPPPAPFRPIPPLCLWRIARPNRRRPLGAAPARACGRAGVRRTNSTIAPTTEATSTQNSSAFQPTSTPVLPMNKTSPMPMHSRRAMSLPTPLMSRKTANPATPPMTKSDQRPSRARQRKRA